MRITGAGRAIGQVRRATAGLLVLVCVGSVSSQSYRSLATGEERGFRAGTVVGMCTDASGTWCATVDRLQFFDGYHWQSTPFVPEGPVLGIATGVSGGVFVWGDAWVCRVLSPADTGSSYQPLSGRRVRDLVDTDAGAFARIAAPKSRFGRLVSVRGKSVSTFTLTAVTDLALGADGVPLAAASRRVYRWDGADWRPIGGFAQSVQRLAAIAGNIVCALGSSTEFGGLGQISIGGEVRWSEGDGAALGALVSNGSDQVAYASGDGRLHVHREGEWIVDGVLDPAAGAIDHLCFGRHGLWVARGTELELLDVREDPWVRLSGGGEASRSVVGLARRRDGSLWWATRRGLMRGDTPVRSIEVAGDRVLTTRGIRGLAEGGDGRLWVVGGRVHPGVLVRDGDGWDLLTSVAKSPLAGVDRVTVDRAGAAWFLSAVRPEVFVARPGEPLERFAPDRGLSGPAAGVAVTASQVWFAVPGFGLEGWDPARSAWSRLPISGGVEDVASLRDGDVWLRDRGGRLGRWDGSTSGVDYPAFVAGRRVLGIMSDGEALWATTARCLLRIQGDRCSEYPWPVGVRPKGLLTRDDDMVLCATASDGVVALSTTSRAPDPVASVKIDLDANRVSWIARPFVLTAEELKARYRTNGGEWSEWSVPEGEIGFVDHEAGEHELEIEVAAATGQVVRSSHKYRVSPRPGSTIVGPWSLGAIVLVMLGLGLLWFRSRSLHARTSRFAVGDTFGVLLLDENGEVVEATDDVASLLCSGAGEELERRSVFELFDGASRELLARAWDDCRDPGGGGDLGEWVAVSCSGGGDSREVRLVRGATDDRVVCQVRVPQEISQSKSSRHTQAMAALGQLTGVVAHDFNNVLQVIVGYGETADDAVANDPEVQFMIRQIVAAGEHGAELVRQLARLPIDDALEPQIVDLQRLVAQKVSFLRRLVGEDVKIRFQRTPEPLFVRVDPIQVTRVLLNLAANARDALTGGGQIRIEVRRAELGSEELAAVIGPDQDADVPLPVVLDFEDDGIGMDEATVRRVFEPYFSTKGTGEGTGLGMAVVHDFAEEAGGVVMVRSEVGEGTHVWIALPGAEPALEIPRQEVASELPRGSGECVLVVEDNLLVQRQFARELEQLGYRVLQATRWEEVEQAANGGLQLDLAIVDVIFGDCSGAGVAECLRAEHPDLAIVYVTGQGEHSATDGPVLRKPVSMSALAIEVRQALDGGGAHSVGDPSSERC